MEGSEQAVKLENGRRTTSRHKSEYTDCCKKRVQSMGREK